MRNFATAFWTRFQNFKDRPAIAAPADGGTGVSLETYWDWTRRVQRIAMGLVQSGIEPGARVGMVLGNSPAWMDLAWAVWLAGGCIVPLVPERDRRETLRCLARSGCEVVAIADMDARSLLRGEASQLPGHLRWILAQAPDELPQDCLGLKKLEELGRSRLARGGLTELAHRTYEVKREDPALILFDPEAIDDPQGAWFTGAALATMLEDLGHDLAVGEGGCLAPMMSFGWFSCLIIALGNLWHGRTLAMAQGLGALRRELPRLKPTHMVCGPAYLEAQASRWLERLDKAPDFLKRALCEAPVAPGEPSPTAFKSLSRALSGLGEKASRRAFFEPMLEEFGGQLQTIWLWRGGLPREVHELYRTAGVELLVHFGFAECGITHAQRPGAAREGSVGRPLEGWACKIDEARGAERGEVMVRGLAMSEGYWSGRGAREREGQWLRSGVQGHLDSGFLFLEP